MCKSTSRGKQIAEMSVEGDDFVENAACTVEMSTIIVLLCIYQNYVTNHNIINVQLNLMFSFSILISLS